MKCPICQADHTSDRYAGCCSRGCMRYWRRRNPLPRRPAVTAPAKAGPMVPLQPRPVIHVDPPPQIEKLYVCNDCKKDTPDWAIYECGTIEGRTVYRCVGCWLTWKERVRTRDDRAVPSSPFEGSGGRVVRGTGSLS